MVVKNEEKGIEKAILSCKDFVDEIVIAIDSESTDDTFLIANKYTTRIKYFNWCDDFSWARNFAHEGVKSDWILFLDGHEYISKVEKLQEYLNLDCDGLLTTVRMENGTEFRNPRIYKNGVQFEGRIHERSQCKKTALCSGVVIQHDRVNSQNSSAINARDEQRKIHMNEIMLNEYKSDPTNLRVLFHLALWYQTQNEYCKTLKFQNLYLKHSKAPSDRYYVLYNRSLLFLTHRKLWRALWAICRAELEEPNRWETNKMKGIIYFAQKRYDHAIHYLVESFDSNKKDFAYKPVKRDDAGTWNLIGECFYSRGIYDKASTSFQLASDRADDDKKKEFFKHRSELMAKMVTGR